MVSVRSGVLRAFVVPVVLVSAFALPRFASAQTTTGSILGTVVDPQGNAVPGATVTVLHEGTSETRVTTSDAERGTFQVTSPTGNGTTLLIEVPLEDQSHALSPAQ